MRASQHSQDKTRKLGDGVGRDVLDWGVDGVADELVVSPTVLEGVADPGEAVAVGVAPSDDEEVELGNGAGLLLADPPTVQKFVPGGQRAVDRGKQRVPPASLQGPDVPDAQPPQGTLVSLEQNELPPGHDGSELEKQTPAWEMHSPLVPGKQPSQVAF